MGRHVYAVAAYIAKSNATLLFRDNFYIFTGSRKKNNGTSWQLVASYHTINFMDIFTMKATSVVQMNGIQCRRLVLDNSWPRGYKTFFMLNSIEHEIFPAHIY